jgi:hypothetical protein
MKPSSGQFLLALASCLAACGSPRQPETVAKQTPATPRASCPPEIRGAIPTYGGSFTLPSTCSARCETGIDTLEATIMCGSLTVDYTAAFEATLRLALSPNDPRVEGHEGGSERMLYWGTTPKGERCAILVLGTTGQRLQHQFCTTHTPGEEVDATLLALARSLNSHEVPDSRSMCPYCG